LINKKRPIISTITVKEILDHYPQVLHVFIEMKLLCIGCPMETFHTLADIVREYSLNRDQFLHRLQYAIENSIEEEEQKS
jgi:hybrid cluster-associated redox disulfide protein